MEGLKNCRFCKVDKVLGLFSKSSSKKDGLQSICKECAKLKTRKWRKDNPDKFREYCISSPKKAATEARYYRANSIRILEYQKEYMDLNREGQRSRCIQYNKENPDVLNAINAKRRSAKLNATIIDSDLDNIKEVYFEAKRLEKLDGIKRHVDHIVPLQGKNVCGLHVSWNLQILTAEENMSKGNKV